MASPSVFETLELCILLLFPVCKFLTGLLLRAFSGARAEYFKVLPMLCINESNEFEPHLARDCTVTLACLAQSILPLNVIPACLESITLVANSTSWKAKAAVLDLLQVTSYFRFCGPCHEWCEDSSSLDISLLNNVRCCFPQLVQQFAVNKV